MSRFFLLALAVLGTMPLASKMFSTTSANRTHSQSNGTEASSRSLSLSELKTIVMDTLRNIGKHDASLLAAGVAFYALFALFPALAAATWIFGLLANPATVHDQLNTLRDVLPGEAWQLIDQQLTTLTSKSSTFSLTGIVSLLIAIYSARTAAASMMGALNVVYGIEETRGFIKAIVDSESNQILGAAVLGIEGGEIMAMLELAMMGQLPFTALREGIFAHPTLAESLNNLFTHFV